MPLFHLPENEFREIAQILGKRVATVNTASKMNVLTVIPPNIAPTIIERPFGFRQPFKFFDALAFWTPSLDIAQWTTDFTTRHYCRVSGKQTELSRSVLNIVTATTVINKYILFEFDFL